MAKTNKSVAKRIRVTKNGKALRRGGGQNHFNAKETRSKQLNAKRITHVAQAKTILDKYLPNR